MNLRSRFGFLGLTLATAFVLSACGGGGGGNSGEVTTPGENLAFSTNTMTVPAGSTITFRNGSSSQQHNYVVVSGGDAAADEVAAAAAGADNYIPEGDPNIVAATQTLNGGQTGTTTAPAAGTYLYICTVPGHYPAMKGTLTVQ